MINRTSCLNGPFTSFTFKSHMIKPTKFSHEWHHDEVLQKLTLEKNNYLAEQKPDLYA